MTKNHSLYFRSQKIQCTALPFSVMVKNKQEEWLSNYAFKLYSDTTPIHTPQNK